MKQTSLFDDDALPAGAGSPVALAGSRQVLTKEQRRFNKLIADIAAARDTLARWREFIGVEQRRHDAHLLPLLQKFRDLRIAMVRVLDEAASGKRLTRAERAKVVDLLQTTLLGLLEEERSPELERLHEKYGESSFDEEHEAGLELMRDMMRETMGVDVDDSASSPEDFARALGEMLEQEEAEAQRKQQARGERGKRDKKDKHGKAAEREALREQAQQGATQSVREVYRRLASELHPDREPNPAERARKTELMQQVNQAYQAGDLLALLELQLKIEQINPAHLAGMARERLLHYNHVLAEQLRQLRAELAELLMPFEGLRMGFALTEAEVRKGLNAECAQMEMAIRDTEADLAAFRDVAQLKRRLKAYRVGQAMQEELADMDELLAMFGEIAAPRARKRR
ncbi:MAG: J domain-containing protein [Betaproteobacteria bacterium]|nr:J domain-containing protein [Betaproteobacteria bacterium]